MAFIALATQLGSVAHLAFVRHVECAEHGGLVEVGASSHSIDHQDATSAVHQDGEQTHGHDHCVIATLRRERAQTNSAPITSTSLPQTDLGHTLVRAIAPPPSIGVLDLAPKNSPPTV